MIEKRQGLLMRSMAKEKANNMCEECGRGAPLMVRTNQFFNYKKYLTTGKIELRELSAVCPNCSKNMNLQSSRMQSGATVYCRIAPDGSVIEYR